MNKANKGYRNLIAWQFANNLAHEIYNVSSSFPKQEMFGLTSQMTRAALSVPANITEGYMRSGTKDKRHFYIIALSSLAELEYYIDFAFERSYYKNTIYNKLSALQTETAKILTGLIKSTK